MLIGLEGTASMILLSGFQTILPPFVMDDMTEKAFMFGKFGGSFAFGGILAVLRVQ
jgi:hypothetical protein